MRATSDPLVRVTGIGQVAGLRPRRRPGDGGEVSGADVDVVDALDPLGRRTVTGWLLDTPSPTMRRGRLRVLASFVRWLRAAEPGRALLAVTGAQVERYCAAALGGELPGGPGVSGKPLANVTVARRRAALEAFYGYAWRHGALLASCDAPEGVGALTRDERRLLRRGVACLAADGRAAEAAAVALLEATGACVDALAGLTARDLCTVADGAGGGSAVVVLQTGRDDIAAFPVPAPARALLRTLCQERDADEPLLRRDDGGPVDLAWVGAALIRAALSGGVPEERASRLHPRLLRAATLRRSGDDPGS
ncbi:hypothetical protein ACWGH8_05710 [Nonomuraea muscovyensis]|uniref:Core-binding (CB) domain-containing protein n=1 Tax=Nonomuraea muscovyensis TaxID=1124761 RepID=A0A7X0C2V5_9ACTN|nr:hypothetical protein [Nonomuraea muscovyensis]MBB6347473.1 hypothetical protein [Nonomuraea muscovyensis]